MNTEEILNELSDERERQAFKWGRAHEWGYGDCSSQAGALGPFSVDTGDDPAKLRQYSDLIKAAVLAEEAGEVVKAALDIDPEAFRAEVVQTLAVAWAILEGIPS